MKEVPSLSQTSNAPMRPGNARPASSGGLAAPRFQRRRGWPGLGASLTLGLITAIWLAGFAWASLSRIESYTSGQGRIVPAQAVQGVQTLEGGILSEILVVEGSKVEEGQVVARISDISAVSELQQLRAKHLATLATIARLEAEIARGEPRFSGELSVGDGRAYAEREVELFRARIAEFRASLGVIERQRDQRREELRATEEKIKGLNDVMVPLEREMAVTRELVGMGHRPQLDLIRIQQRVAETESQLRTANGQLSPIRAAIRESDQRLEERQRSYDAQIRAELGQRHAELAATNEALRNLRDRVERRDLRAPTRGEVKQIRMKTIGGVLQPGQALMEIVPAGDMHVVEVPIAPADIAFISSGMAARIKVTAYDQTIHGWLPGRVEYVSPDAIVNDKGEAYFQIRVRPDRPHLGTVERPLPLVPGMTTVVDVVTGERTILGYLLKPVLRATDRALSER